MTKAQRWIAPAYGGADVLELVNVDLPEPRAGEVTLEVRAAGVNPADLLRIAAGDAASLPVAVGYEAAGVIAAIGPGTHIGSGGGAIGDEVVAFQIVGGYSTAVTVPAQSVFAKPASLDFAQAAGLLLVGTTAAEMVDVSRVRAGDTVVVHGASGGVGLSALQQLRLADARVIGTTSSKNADVVASFGATPVQYGEGLEARIRALAPGGVDAALDTVGTDEAVDVSLNLVSDRSRVVSIAAFGRAGEGFPILGANNPSSGPFRDRARTRLLQLAADRALVSTVAATYPLSRADDALVALSRPRRRPGKIILLAE